MTTTPIPVSQRIRVALEAVEMTSPTPPPKEATLARTYVVDRLLGEGGMGQVLAAHDTKLGRTVAIKKLHEVLLADPRLRGRFVTEAQIGGQLEHPNIVPVYGFELAPDGSPAFVMQLITGRTLDDYIAECLEAPAAERAGTGRYSLKERLSKLLPVCDAIDYAHSRGVIHRDLKPANVMIGSHNEVLVMDWGIARLLDDSAFESATSHPGDATEPTPPAVGPFSGAPGTTDPHAPTFVSISSAPVSDEATRPITSKRIVTQLGEVMGTPHYMAPEQAAGMPVEEAADQFSLGLIAYELAALHPARETLDVNVAYALALQGTYGEHVGARGEPFDPRLSAILRRATDPMAARRYPSVVDFANDLRRFVRDEEVSVLPDGRAVKLLRRMQRHPVRSVSAVFAVLLTLGVTAMISLYASALRAREGEADARTLGRLTARTAVISRTVEGELLGLEASLRSLGASTAVQLALAPEDAEARWLVPADFDAGRVPEAIPHPIDGQARSYERPVYVFAPGAGAEAPSLARRLGGLDRSLAELALESIVSDPASIAPERRRSVFVGTRRGLVRLGIAFREGLYVQFPGRSGFPAAFDARETDWYRSAVRSGRRHFARPKYGPRGRTVRIAIESPLRREGRTEGVIVAETLLDGIIDALEMGDEPGFRRGFLATHDGLELASPRVLAEATSRVGAPEAFVELPHVRSAVLERALASATGSGFVIDGDTLFLYDRMAVEDWFYVAELDRRRCLSLVR